MAVWLISSARRTSIRLPCGGNNLTEEFSCSSVIYGPGAAAQNFSCEVSAYGEVMYGLTFEANFGRN